MGFLSLSGSKNTTLCNWFHPAVTSQHLLTGWGTHIFPFIFWEVEGKREAAAKKAQMFHENVLSCVKNYIKLLQSHESFATCAQRHRETRHFEGNVLCLKHKPPFKESTVAGEASDLCGVTRTLNSVVIKMHRAKSAGILHCFPVTIACRTFVSS